MDKKTELGAERLLAEQLMEGGAGRANPDEEAVKRLPPRWEIRIQTERDPVAEETAIYRSIANEVDSRYDHVKHDMCTPQTMQKERSQ